MGWVVGQDLAAHLRVVEAFLAADPVAHTTQLTVLDALAQGVRWSSAPPLFAVHRTGDTVDAAAAVTPPHPLLLDGHADPGGLVAALRSPGLAGVNAPEPDAVAFAAAWTRVHGGSARPSLRLHLLELTDPAALVEPPATAAVRPAGAGDVEATFALLVAMQRELEEAAPLRRVVEDRVAAGLVWLAERDGRAVATAQATSVVAGVARIAGVYTPPAHRRRGHAAAVTAAATRAGFAAGAERMCLFTDASAPTPNGVYERLGYVRRPRDRVVLQFG